MYASIQRLFHVQPITQSPLEKQCMAFQRLKIVFIGKFKSNFQSIATYIHLNYKLFKLIFSEGDCVSYENIDGLDCAGKTSCSIPYKLRSLPECDKKYSNYIRVKYDCVPGFLNFIYKRTS